MSNAETEKAVQELKSRLGEAVVDVITAIDGVPTIQLEPFAITEALDVLRRNPPDAPFDMLTDLTAVDWLDYPEVGERFEVVYHLCSTAANRRVRLKCRLPELNPRIKSAVSVYKGAEWMEREVWDLFGIRFDGHPDLRRIMMWEDYEGHPLRKDYPTRGPHPVERTPET